MGAPFVKVVTIVMHFTSFTSIACVLLMLLPFSASAQTRSRMTEAEWRDRFNEKKAELHAKPVEIVFLGDSILHSFEWTSPDPIWDHWYGGRNAVNLGFNGDGVGNVIWRVENGEFDGIAPKLAVVLIGTNDLWMAAHTIVGNISTLVRAIHQRAPATRILVLGILPSGKPETQIRTTHAVNTALAAMYGRPDASAIYLDVSCVFLRHGLLNAALFRERAVPDVSEPLHPTLHGMDLLAARIEPIVAAILDDKRRSTPGYPMETDCQAGG